MYNSFRKGTEAHWAMQESIGAHQELTKAVDTVEDTLENLCGQIDTFEEEIEEISQERDDLLTKVETLEEDTQQIITFLKEMYKIHATGIVYARKRLIALGEEDAVKAVDSSIPNSGNAGPENTDAKSTGETSSEGVTRPQVP
jgi:DNA repair ATPase RecN